MGCRRRAEVTGLVRLRRARDGTVALGAGPGRGAWICAPPAAGRCLDEATRGGALDRALRVRLGGDEVGALRAKLETMSG